jgi:hypothetical protein
LLLCIQVDANAASVTRTERASIIAKTAVVLQSAVFAAQTAEPAAATPDSTTATTTEPSATLVSLLSMAGTVATNATNNSSKGSNSGDRTASKGSSSGCEQVWQQLENCLQHESTAVQQYDKRILELTTSANAAIHERGEVTAKHKAAVTERDALVTKLDATKQSISLSVTSASQS